MNKKSFVLVALMALVLVGCNKEKEESVPTVESIEQQQQAQPNTNNSAMPVAPVVQQQQITPQAPQEAIAEQQQIPQVAVANQQEAQPVDAPQQTQAAPISGQPVVSNNEATTSNVAQGNVAPGVNGAANESNGFVTAPSSGVSSNEVAANNTTKM